MSNKELTDPMSFSNPAKKELVDPMSFNDTPIKSTEEKIYIVLCFNDGTEEFDGIFKICKGRTKCFRFIETIVQAYGEQFDPFEARVITETLQTNTKTGEQKYYMINYEDSISVYSFCKAVEDFYVDNDFKIDQYYKSMITEEKDEDPNAAFLNHGIHKVYENIIGEESHIGQINILKNEGDKDTSINV